MDNSYLTGRGFIGKHLLKKASATHIPHTQISRYSIKDFSYFYFLSTYGNMVYHSEGKSIMEANVVDVIDIMEKVCEKDFKSFVYMSSSSVKLRVQTMYSRAKRAAEEVLLSYMERYDKPICIIRPYSVTGVGEQSTHLIPTLIRSCYTGELVNFVPHPMHDWIDIEDVVDGIINLSSHSARGIFELGTGRGYTNQQVLDIVEQETGRKANINVVNSLRDYDNENWVSTNFRSRSYGWAPKIDLKTSIRNMVAEYRKGRELN